MFSGNKSLKLSAYFDIYPTLDNDSVQPLTDESKNRIFINIYKNKLKMSVSAAMRNNNGNANISNISTRSSIKAGVIKLRSRTRYVSDKIADKDKKTRKKKRIPKSVNPTNNTKLKHSSITLISKSPSRGGGEAITKYKRINFDDKSKSKMKINTSIKTSTKKLTSQAKKLTSQARKSTSQAKKLTSQAKKLTSQARKSTSQAKKMIAIRKFASNSNVIRPSATPVEIGSSNSGYHAHNCASSLKCHRQHMSNKSTSSSSSSSFNDLTSYSSDASKDEYSEPLHDFFPKDYQPETEDFLTFLCLRLPPSLSDDSDYDNNGTNSHDSNNAILSPSQTKAMRWIQTLRINCLNELKSMNLHNDCARFPPPHQVFNSSKNR